MNRSVAGIALHGVGLAGDGQDPLPRAAAHVEAPRRVLDQLGDGDVHLGASRACICTYIRGCVCTDISGSA